MDEQGVRGHSEGGRDAGAQRAGRQSGAGQRTGGPGAGARSAGEQGVAEERAAERSASEHGASEQSASEQSASELSAAGPDTAARTAGGPGGALRTAGGPGVAERVIDGLARIGQVLRQHAWRRAHPRRLTATQARVLALLATRAPRPRVGRLAGELAVTPATASDALAALRRKGLVRRRRVADDGRGAEVVLTAAGRRRAAQVAEWPEPLLAAVAALPEAEQAALLRGLIGMVRALQERGQIAVARMCVTCRYFRPRAYADPGRPHHCDYVDAPFGDRDLRLDCPDHAAAAPAAQAAVWSLFVHGRAVPPAGAPGAAGS